MIFDTAYMITALVTLLVVVDPIAIAPIFLAVTPNMSATQRERIARHAVLVGLLILVIFALAGKAVLDFIGISMAAFRVAGGILLFLTALDMLFERRPNDGAVATPSAPAMTQRCFNEAAHAIPMLPH